MAVSASGTGSAVLPGATRLRRGVRVLRNGAAAVVAMLLGGRGGHGGAAIRTLRLRDVVGVLRGDVGAVVDVLLGGVWAGAVAVRAVRLRVVVVVVAVSYARAKLSGVWGCGRHDDLKERHKEVNVDQIMDIISV